MALIELPTELLLGVWQYLEEEHDMNRFVRTCQRFYKNFNGPLYRHNVVSSGQAIPWAAENGRHETLQKLLDQGAGQIIEYDEWPLFTAAEHGQAVIVEMLFKAGNTPHMKDERGTTALFHAAKGGHTEVINLLLEKGAEINAQNNSEDSALRWATKYDRPDAVALLLEKGADPDRIEDDYTHLIYAAKDGSAEVVRVLLKWTKDINTKDPRYQETALMWAAENGRKRVVDILLDAGADIHAADNSGMTALSYAVKKGHRYVVAALLRKGADPEAPVTRRQTCLARAAEEGHLEIVRLLLAHGAAPDAKSGYSDRRPLSFAVENGHKAIVRCLLGTDRVDIDARDREGLTALSWAAAKGDFNAVTTLLERGARPDNVDGEGRTPLAWATTNGHSRVARHLLKQPGVDPNTTDSNHESILRIAVKQEATALVRDLLKHGADPTICDDMGRTPLSVAAERGYTKTVLVLLDDGTPRRTWSGRAHAIPDGAECPCPSGRFIRAGRGRAIDTPDKFGRTPLFFATLHAHEDIVRALLSRGSSAIETPTAAGRTPLSVAAEHKDAAIEAKQFYRLQYIWQWFRYPSEANVDAVRMAEAAKLPIEPDADDYPWCDHCRLSFFPWDTMFHCDCNGDNYDLCAECLGGGIKCLDETHVPSEREIGWRT
ncbi:predicted protein [Aspergillus terreus NIH2624]|uniref:Uncharacterized protein n=1 Tax=Aspergillus terreus (strain NIH 2624 / FGSC A1156) TaxID=341663 RepID=Q0CFI5_ASPTN|nr:uncharacterized protein ATEG_07549 [Aspergillus terreus NIH2624]EAU31811.1 predicted protein [Aspergillus terreus NIH2624]